MILDCSTITVLSFGAVKSKKRLRKVLLNPAVGVIVVAINVPGENKSYFYYFTTTNMQTTKPAVKSSDDFI
jgi:hypothetical protein